MILKCDCSHAWQDRICGPGMRIMNECTKKEDKSQQKYRCTVCGKERVGDIKVKAVEVVAGAPPDNAGSRGASHARASSNKRRRG
jgi:hypothetical protein